MDSDFKEIGHCGGKITFKVSKDLSGQVSIGTQWSSTRPTPATIAGVYALENGLAVAPLKMAGIGEPWSPPPFSGCFPVLIGSDSQGKFGHSCPRCDGYWRSNPFPNFCPYCGVNVQMSNSLSPAQKKYVQHYMSEFSRAFSEAQDGLPVGDKSEFIIDLDVVADAVSSVEKPEFYISEESHQSQFNCYRCGQFNDVIGRYAYCSICAVRNDIKVAQSEIDEIRESINSKGRLPIAIRGTVSLFDSFVRQTTEQLIELVPMTKRRRSMLEGRSFHNFREVEAALKECFDIDICDGLKDSDVNLIVKLFHRRHVHEHNGGIVDQKYIDESGDAEVRLNQVLRENLEEVHKFLGFMNRIFSNIHNQFNEIIPPAQIQ